VAGQPWRLLRRGLHLLPLSVLYVCLCVPTHAHERVSPRPRGG
jgi:hypothetical protein